MLHTRYTVFFSFLLHEGDATRMSKVREEKAGWVARAFSISDRVGELPSRGFALVRVNCEG